MRLNAYDKEIIAAVKVRISSDLQRHYTIEELSVEFAIGTNKLKSGFKILYGYTIYQFLLRKRMQYAEELIGEDRKSLQQIAAATGFKYLPNFITAFKKYHKVTPGRSKPK